MGIHYLGCDPVLRRRYNDMWRWHTCAERDMLNPVKECSGLYFRLVKWAIKEIQPDKSWGQTHFSISRTCGVMTLEPFGTIGALPILIPLNANDNILTGSCTVLHACHNYDIQRWNDFSLWHFTMFLSFYIQLIDWFLWQTNYSSDVRMRSPPGQGVPSVSWWSWTLRTPSARSPGSTVCIWPRSHCVSRNAHAHAQTQHRKDCYVITYLNAMMQRREM